MKTWSWEAKAQHQVPSEARRAIVSSVYVSKAAAFQRKEPLLLPGPSDGPLLLMLVCLGGDGEGTAGGRRGDGGGTAEGRRHFRLCGRRKRATVMSTSATIGGGGDDSIVWPGSIYLMQ